MRGTTPITNDGSHAAWAKQNTPIHSPVTTVTPRVPDLEKQKGIASVELVLIIPFMLLIFILTITSAKIMLLKQNNIVEARTMAWEKAMLDRDCTKPPQKKWDGQFLGVECPADGGSGQHADQFLRFMEEGPNSRYQQVFTGKIKEGEDLPGIATATARSHYSLIGNDTIGFVDLPMEDSHSVDASPAVWAREKFPIGYDDYLKRQLDSQLVFPDFFPRAD